MRISDGSSDVCSSDLIAIGGALLWALQPSAPKTAENLYSAYTANPAEVVTGAPADYGKVPKLGPPLPGDLGRPIVAAQQNGEIVPVPPIGQTPPDGRSLADEARERARQERESAQTRSEEHRLNSSH